MKNNMKNNMKNYLIHFHTWPSIVMEAPDAESAKRVCCSKVCHCEEISDDRKTILVDKFGLKFVKWMF